MAKMIIGGRPTKAALSKVKVATVAVSLAAFLGSLGVIAANDQTTTATAATQSAGQVALVSSTAASATGSAATTTVQQRPGFSAPLTRSRGS